MDIVERSPYRTESRDLGMSFVVKAETPEGLALALLKAYAKTRRWDFPPSLYAAIPYEESFHLDLDETSVSHVPVGTGTKTLLVPIKLNDPPTEDTPWSQYHALAGIRVVDATSVVMVQEAYMGAPTNWENGQQRPLADTPNAEEVRFAVCVRPDGTVGSGFHTRGQIPSTKDSAMRMSGGTYTFIKRIIGAPVVPATIEFDIERVAEQLFKEFPYNEDDGMFHNMFPGDNYDAEARSAVDVLRDPISRVDFDDVLGSDLCDMLRVPEGSPRIGLTSGLASWLSEPGMYQIVSPTRGPIGSDESTKLARIVWRRYVYARMLEDDVRVEELLGSPLAAAIFEGARAGGVEDLDDIASDDSETRRFTARGFAMATASLHKKVDLAAAGAPSWLVEASEASYGPMDTAPGRVRSVALFLSQWVEACEESFTFTAD